MGEDYYKQLKVKELINICRDKKIKNYTGKIKIELIDLIILETKKEKEKVINENQISKLSESKIKNDERKKKIDEIKKILNRSSKKILPNIQESEKLNHINCKNGNEKEPMENIDYLRTIEELKKISKMIPLKKQSRDGRLESAISENYFLKELKKLLLENNPSWNIVIPPPRYYCDIIVNSIPINLKLSDCKSSDNSINKKAIYFSITGSDKYPSSSNWNDFLEKILETKSKNGIKSRRKLETEYHFLVKNKTTGEILLKSIFDIHTYISNASNDLQINWKNEFLHIEHFTEEKKYVEKIKTLLSCIQTSVQQKIKRTENFAIADFDSIFNMER